VRTKSWSGQNFQNTLALIIYTPSSSSTSTLQLKDLFVALAAIYLSSSFYFFIIINLAEANS